MYRNRIIKTDLSPIESAINQVRATSRRKIKRPIRQLFPSAVEREYLRMLRQYVKGLIDTTNDFIVAQLPQIFADINTDSDIKTDDFSTDLIKAIRAARLFIGLKYTDDFLENFVRDAGEKTSQYNNSQLSKAIKSSIGVDIFASQPFLNPLLKAFTTENVGLIKTISDRHFSKIQNIIFSSARQGLRHEDVAKEIRSTFSTTRNISDRIARDQISKFNGKLTEVRQKNLGINKYIWRTVGDERVRDSHAELDGQEFSWDNPPSVGNPGEDINCRCYAEPVLDEPFTSA